MLNKSDSRTRPLTDYPASSFGPTKFRTPSPHDPGAAGAHRGSGWDWGCGRAKDGAPRAAAGRECWRCRDRRRAGGESGRRCQDDIVQRRSARLSAAIPATARCRTAYGSCSTHRRRSTSSRSTTERIPFPGTCVAHLVGALLPKSSYSKRREGRDQCGAPTAGISSRLAAATSGRAKARAVGVRMWQSRPRPRISRLAYNPNRMPVYHERPSAGSSPVCHTRS